MLWSGRKPTVARFGKEACKIRNLKGLLNVTSDQYKRTLHSQPLQGAVVTVAHVVRRGNRLSKDSKPRRGDIMDASFMSPLRGLLSLSFIVPALTCWATIMSLLAELRT